MAYSPHVSAKKSILVVDDDPKIIEALESLFTKTGYVTNVAQTGQLALVKLLNQPDLVVLDLMLPDVNGYEICQHIRSAERYTPILMLTARDESTDKVKGLDLGADVYMVKPFEPSELLAQVRALFRRLDTLSPNDSERPLICGSLTMWVKQHQVKIADRVVDLTPKEFELLHFLLRHIGQVLGRETLLREMWGYNFEGDSRTVDVHIQRLRLKIEPDPTTPQFIQTVRGFGYRLTSPEDS